MGLALGLRNFETAMGIGASQRIALKGWEFEQKTVEIVSCPRPSHKSQIPLVREKQRGVENSGEGKTYHKTSPQKRLWTPPPMIRFPPPPWLTPCHFLKGNGHRPDQSRFLSQNWFWRARCIVRFPPEKLARYVLPPICSCPKLEHISSNVFRELFSD